MERPRPIQLLEDVDPTSLDHVLNEHDTVFSEAVFAKGKAQIKELEPLVEKIQNKLKEEMTKGGKVNLEKFWKDTVWRDFEHKLMDSFGFKTIVFDLIDDNATKRGKKLNLPNFNVWIQSLVRYPIEAIVTDEGFYDKSRSLEAFVSVSTWFLLKLTPAEFISVFLHEMGHGIDPAIVDIRYAQTNMISDYLLDRKKPSKKERQKWMDKSKSLMGELAFVLSFWALYILFLLILINAGNGGGGGEKNATVPNNWFANAWSRIQRLFMGKEKYDQWVEKKYEEKLRKILEKEKKNFTKYNNMEAFADNFPRMYGYGAELVKALQKMQDAHIKQVYKSRFKQDIERRKFITNMLYRGIMDEHGTNVQRAQQLLKEYDQDLKDPKIPAKVKASIKEDRDELAKVTDQYLNHFDAFHNKMNQMIFNALNEGNSSKKSDGKKSANKDEAVKESAEGD